MPELNCCDGPGCIRLFKKIDPAVSKVVAFSGGKPDMVYAKTKEGRWIEGNPATPHGPDAPQKDPWRLKHAELLSELRSAFGGGTFTTHEVVQQFAERPRLSDAVAGVCRKQLYWPEHQLGLYLARVKGRVVEGLRIERAEGRERNRVASWRVRLDDEEL